MSNQALRQASVRAATGTAYDYNGDWSALFDLAGVPAYDWNGRLLAYINLKLGTPYTEINGAMAAFAIANGAPDWNSLGTFPAALFDPAATALFARMTVQPDNTRKALINSTIVGLKTSGIWAKADALYVTAAHDAQSARLNWVQDLYNLTAINAPTFTVDRGYAGDGSTSSLVTGITPETASLKFKQDSSHISFYNRSVRAADASIQMGVFTGSTATYLQTRGTGDQFNQALNDAGSAPAIANAANPGLYAIDRASSAQFLAFKNGAQVGTSVIASTAPTNAAQFGILFITSDGGSLGFTTDQVGCATIGASLGVTMQGQLYTAIQAYMTAIGANV
ncbi:hypothetical protein AB4037_08610 [Labrys sp. KB_33_2]|uniref:hypothetical protein n=1 Tax=Labrys sp. KB_33_2 TaxID=3237479 RepID=UPI003F90588F